MWLKREWREIIFHLQIYSFCPYRYRGLFDHMWPLKVKQIFAYLLCLFSISDRKNEFGIGVELAAEGKKLMQIQQDRLGRSLERLSTELYSKDTHFVLELIQVASSTFTPAQMLLYMVLYMVAASGKSQLGGSRDMPTGEKNKHMEGGRDDRQMYRDDNY